MNKGQTIIDIASKEIGYSENPPNSNNTKYGTWFGLSGLAWCGIFVSWVYDQAKCNLGIIGYSKGFAGCQTAVMHFTKTNEVTTKPTTGDIVFFDWNGDLRYDHVGLFEKDIDGVHFQTIEGNTSLGNDSNGGQVMRRIRTYKGCIFVHPKVLS